MYALHSQYECGWLRGGVYVELGTEEVRVKKIQAETIWTARSHMGQSLLLSCVRGLCQGAGEETWGVGHHRSAIVWEKRFGAGVGVGAQQSAFAVAFFGILRSKQ